MTPRVVSIPVISLPAPQELSSCLKQMPSPTKQLRSYSTLRRPLLAYLRGSKLPRRLLTAEKALLQKAAQVAVSHRMTQFAQRFRLYLPNALAGHIEVLPDLF